MTTEISVMYGSEKVKAVADSVNVVIPPHTYQTRDHEQSGCDNGFPVKYVSNG